MKWKEILRKDGYALLQSESNTQYCVANDYDPTQSEDQQWNYGTYSLIGMIQNEKPIVYRMLWIVLEAKQKAIMLQRDRSILKFTEKTIAKAHSMKFYSHLI